MREEGGEIHGGAASCEASNLEARRGVLCSFAHLAERSPMCTLSWVLGEAGPGSQSLRLQRDPQAPCRFLGRDQHRRRGGSNELLAPCLKKSLLT